MSVGGFNELASQNPEQLYSMLSEASIEEAKFTEEQLLNFYRDPKGDGSERWWLAEFTLDYLRFFKPEGSKRKTSPLKPFFTNLGPLL